MKILWYNAVVLYSFGICNSQLSRKSSYDTDIATKQLNKLESLDSQLTVMQKHSMDGRELASDLSVDKDKQAEFISVGEFTRFMLNIWILRPGLIVGSFLLSSMWLVRHSPTCPRLDFELTSKPVACYKFSFADWQARPFTIIIEHPRKRLRPISQEIFPNSKSNDGRKKRDIRNEPDSNPTKGLNEESTAPDSPSNTSISYHNIEEKTDTSCPSQITDLENIPTPFQGFENYSWIDDATLTADILAIIKPIKGESILEITEHMRNQFQMKYRESRPNGLIIIERIKTQLCLQLRHPDFHSGRKLRAVNWASGKWPKLENFKAERKEISKLRTEFIDLENKLSEFGLHVESKQIVRLRNSYAKIKKKAEQFDSHYQTVRETIPYVAKIIFDEYFLWLRNFLDETNAAILNWEECNKSDAKPLKATLHHVISSDVSRRVTPTAPNELSKLENVEDATRKVATRVATTGENTDTIDRNLEILMLKISILKPWHESCSLRRLLTIIVEHPDQTEQVEIYKRLFMATPRKPVQNDWQSWQRLMLDEFRRQQESLKIKAAKYPEILKELKPIDALLFLMDLAIPEINPAPSPSPGIISV